MRYAERSIAAREREGLAVDVQLDGQAGAADLVEQRVEAVEARLGRELDVVPVAAHRAEETAHLGERRAAGLLDAPERIAVLGRRIGKLVPDGADLEHHHADGVGDDVVELARDPRTLLRHRDACRRLALALGVRRALSAASACSARSRSAKPAIQRDANRSGMKMSWLAVWWPGMLSTTIEDADR